MLFLPAIDCGSLSSTNIIPVTNTRFNGSSVLITCENGYQVEGTTETMFQSTCQANGVWNAQPNCVGEFVIKLEPILALVLSTIAFPCPFTALCYCFPILSVTPPPPLSFILSHSLPPSSCLFLYLSFPIPPSVPLLITPSLSSPRSLSHSSSLSLCLCLCLSLFVSLSQISHSPLSLSISLLISFFISFFSSFFPFSFYLSFFLSFSHYPFQAPPHHCQFAYRL